MKGLTVLKFSNVITECCPEVSWHFDNFIINHEINDWNLRDLIKSFRKQKEKLKKAKTKPVRLINKVPFKPLQL